MGSQVSDATAVMVALRRIVRALRLAEQGAAAKRLSAAQLFVLHALAAAPARSLGELAGRTLTDQSSVSTVVTKLVAKKLVARTVAKTDRRRTELKLTAAGMRIVRATPRLPQTLIMEAIGAMPAAQRRELVRSIERLVVAIGATGVEPRMFEE